MPPVKKTQFEQDVNGNFGGVGMEVGIKDGVATVISPLPDSPAKKAGILAGDKIVKVGATSTASMNIDQVINFIRGPKGTKVTVTLVRAKVEQPIVVTLTRDTIVIPTVETKKYPDGVFSISLFNFSAQSPALFRNALQEFVDSGDTKLILDLRGNPGGYLEAAVDIASWFLPAKAVIVREAKGKGLPENVYVSKGYNIFQKLGRPIKMEILVDQGSASAAEILAGALAQNGVGEMVGQKTFGKGSVQELVPVTPETSLKITVAKWLTPDGTSISHNGLMPKYVVNLTIDDVKAGRDPQKDKAIQLLTK
jgi:carboxyl-terminal processing protease